jgi:hypothetical protein
MKYLLDYDRLQVLRSLSQKYASGSPYPHIILDGFLSDYVIKKLINDFPPPDSSYWSKKSVLTSRKSDSRRLDKDVYLTDFMRSLMWELNSSRFLLLLSDLTGITGLLSDSYYEGAGPHMIETGGFLKIHADFNVHPYTGLHRRLNLLLYLNEGWLPEWGGDLELWARDMSKCEGRVSPISNRVVIFNTDSDSYHGHPEPLRTPQGCCRKSLALYYYTAPQVELNAHSTIYVKDN